MNTIACFIKQKRKEVGLTQEEFAVRSGLGVRFARELERLRVSLEAAKADGYRRFILFLHYPPTSILEDESCFTRIAEEYRAEQVIYAHSHGESRFYDSVLGEKNGVEYKLVSGDFLKWKPVKIMD